MVTYFLQYEETASACPRSFFLPNVTPFTCRTVPIYENNLTNRVPESLEPYEYRLFFPIFPLKFNGRYVK